ncbi:MAG TPA: ATP-binding protein [Candidatus Dormibacteraeota bacterium]
MGTHQEPFEFHASLTELGPGLETLHDSVRMLRVAIGRANDDHALMLFETALGEIGANVLTHGRPNDDIEVDYILRSDGAAAFASFVDRGPAVADHLARPMPDQDREAGRGLAIARSVLDELGYMRQGEVNTWRLVKRL